MSDPNNPPANPPADPPADPPATKEVELYGQKLTLPTAEADALIAKRDERTASYNALRDEREKAEREAREAREAADREAREKQALQAAKDGEIEKARELLGKEHSDQIRSYESRITSLEITAVLANRGDVVQSPAALSDISGLLRNRVGVVDGKVTPLSEDGSPLKTATGAPVTMDEFVGQFLADRPHYLRAQTPPGSGAGDAGKPPQGRTITNAEFQAMSGVERAKFIGSGGTVK